METYTIFSQGTTNTDSSTTNTYEEQENIALCVNENAVVNGGESSPCPVNVVSLVPIRDSLSPVHLSWPSMLPIPSEAVEKLYMKCMGYRRLHESYCEEGELHTQVLCAENSILKDGLLLEQALGIYRSSTLYVTKTTPADDIARQQAGELFETELSDLLEAVGIDHYRTEKMQKDIFYAKCAQDAQDAQAKGIQYTPPALPGTPDVIFDQEVFVNGTRIYWMEIKTNYAVGHNKSKNNPVGRALKQVNRYSDLYGPGAVVFKRGYGEEFKRKLHPNILALDGAGMEWVYKRALETRNIAAEEAHNCSSSNVGAMVHGSSSVTSTEVRNNTCLDTTDDSTETDSCGPGSGSTVEISSTDENGDDTTE